MSSSLRCFQLAFIPAALLALTIAADLPLHAQQIFGTITGTVKDATGAAVPDVTVTARNIATNLTVTAHTQSNGSYSISNLPAGTYELTFTKEGFDTERHTEVLVNGDRTTTVDGDLKVGTVTTTVDVVGTPLMNQVDTTNGYVVDQATIENTPLGTGSFTQLAILSPGVHADFLGGAGSNAGLGNQAIFANGQRDTSNSFSLNGISTNNLFNGNSTSQVGENRFVLNTGENFGAGGEIQTSTSVYGAIGQALPTPPPEAIQEIAVNSAMYDATQGANSGAHISVLTKSGTNELHGEVYEKFQNSDMNAAPFFYNASPHPRRPFPEPQSIRRHARRPHQEGQAVLLPLLPGRAHRRLYRFHQGSDRSADAHQRPQRAGNHQHRPGRLRYNHPGQPDQPAGAGVAASQGRQRSVFVSQRSNHQSDAPQQYWVTTRWCKGPTLNRKWIRESPMSTTF